MGCPNNNYYKKEKSHVCSNKEACFNNIEEIDDVSTEHRPGTYLTYFSLQEEIAKLRNEISTLSKKLDSLYYFIHGKEE
jgi:hypothetical protein